jgi:hypothetical protein
MPGGRWHAAARPGHGLRGQAAAQHRMRRRRRLRVRLLRTAGFSTLQYLGARPHAGVAGVMVATAGLVGIEQAIVLASVLLRVATGDDRGPPLWLKDEIVMMQLVQGAAGGVLLDVAAGAEVALGPAGDDSGQVGVAVGADGDLVGPGGEP